MIKPVQKTTFRSCSGVGWREGEVGVMGLKCRICQEAHLWSLLILHTKFQLPSSIGSGDKVVTDFFQNQKEGKILILPLLLI